MDRVSSVGQSEFYGSLNKWILNRSLTVLLHPKPISCAKLWNIEYYNNTVMYMIHSSYVLVAVAVCCFGMASQPLILVFGRYIFKTVSCFVFPHTWQNLACQILVVALITKHCTHYSVQPVS